MTDIVASLVFDSWTEPHPELRASVRQDRHLIFEGDGVILDLLIKKQGDGTCIQVGGQILPGHEALSTVSNVLVLMEQGSQRVSTYSNALGEFTFRAIPNDKFDLTITLSDKRFMVLGLSNAEPREWRVVPIMAAGGNGR
jgi:hypothetical protein